MNAGLSATCIEIIHNQALRSIEDATALMAKTQVAVEKTKNSKDGKNKVLAKAGEIVDAMLEPASKVASLLKAAGTFYPPCGVAGDLLEVRLPPIRASWNHY